MTGEGSHDGLLPNTSDSPVHVSYLAGYIFLSYVISSMGCATTLELLHRRTSRSGFYNWYVNTNDPLFSHNAPKRQVRQN